MTDSHVVVTSFNARQWDDPFTRECVQSLAENWPCPVHAYVDGGVPLAKPPEGVEVHDLDRESVWLEEFKRLYTDVTHPLVWGENRGPEWQGVYDYRYDAVRFAHKVAALGAARRDHCGKCLVWIDADVLTHAPLTEADLDQIAPPGKVSYLGRGRYAPDCGFVGWGDAIPLEMMESIYRGGNIFGFEEWHDSHVFDQVRGIVSNARIIASERKVEYVNLSEGIPGKHVWPKTILAKWMTHYKGPARKRDRRDYSDAELDRLTAEEGMRVRA